MRINLDQSRRFGHTGQQRVSSSLEASPQVITDAAGPVLTWRVRASFAGSVRLRDCIIRWTTAPDGPARERHINGDEVHRATTELPGRRQQFHRIGLRPSRALLRGQSQSPCVETLIGGLGGNEMPTSGSLAHQCDAAGLREGPCSVNTEHGSHRSVTIVHLYPSATQTLSSVRSPHDTMRANDAAPRAHHARPHVGTGNVVGPTIGAQHRLMMGVPSMTPRATACRWRACSRGSWRPGLRSCCSCRGGDRVGGSGGRLPGSGCGEPGRRIGLLGAMGITTGVRPRSSCAAPGTAPGRRTINPFELIVEAPTWAESLGAAQHPPPSHRHPPRGAGSPMPPPPGANIERGPPFIPGQTGWPASAPYWRSESRAFDQTNPPTTRAPTPPCPPPSRWRRSGPRAEPVDTATGPLLRSCGPGQRGSRDFR